MDLRSQPPPGAHGVGRRPTLGARIGATLRARPGRALGLVAVVLALVVVVLVWFEPQALLFDTVVDEDLPTVDPERSEAGSNDAPSVGGPGDGADAMDEDMDEDMDGDMAGDMDGDMADDVAGGDVASETGAIDVPVGPVAISSGPFSSRSRYTVTGEAVVFELPDGRRTLRLEEFASTNGPDLYVYLAAGDASDEDATLDEDTIDLGALKGNVGSQNYDIPDDVDLERYDTVVIWCLRFTVGFGAADLAPIAS